MRGSIHASRRRLHPAAGILLGMLIAAALACVPSGPEDAILGPDDRGGFSITLAWDAPTHDVQGHALDDLETYRIYHGPEEPLTADNGEVVEVDADETRHTVRGLPPGDRFFAVTAVDSNGNESELSEVVSVRLGDL